MKHICLNVLTNSLRFIEDGEETLPEENVYEIEEYDSEYKSTWIWEIQGPLENPYYWRWLLPSRFKNINKRKGFEYWGVIYIPKPKKWGDSLIIKI